MSTKSLYNWWKVIGTPAKNNLDHDASPHAASTMVLPNFYPYLTRFEMTELVATRAEGLANNALPRVTEDAWREDYDEIHVARQELTQGQLGDYHILRRYPNNQPILIPVAELFVKSSY